MRHPFSHPVASGELLSNFSRRRTRIGGLQRVIAMVLALSASAALVAAQDRHYLVFFDYERALVTIEGQKVLDQAVAEFKNGRAQRISIIGHTDSAESASDLLSAARSQAIASVLMAKGIPFEKIEMKGSGARVQMAPTKPKTKEPINRRAEVILKQ